MTQSPHSGIQGDRALQAGDEDRLGFRQIAARIATSLVDHASDGGLVVGINGAWGTGKSSLLSILGLIEQPSRGRYWLDGQEVVPLCSGRLHELRNRRMYRAADDFRHRPLR